MVGSRGFILAHDAPIAEGFTRREKTGRVARQVMVSVASDNIAVDTTDA